MQSLKQFFKKENFLNFKLQSKNNATEIKELLQTGNGIQNYTDTAKIKQESDSREQDDQVKKTSKMWYIWMYAVLLHGIIWLSISYASVQYLANSVPENELNVFRYLAGSLLSVFNLIKPSKGDTIFIPKSMLPAFVLSTLLSVACNTCRYTAAALAPLGVVGSLSTGARTISTMLITICRKEDRKIEKVIAAIFSVVGIVLVSQPDFIFGKQNNDVILNSNLTYHNSSNQSYHKSKWISPCLSHLMYMYNENTTSYTISDNLLQFIKPLYLGYILAILDGVFLAINWYIMQWYVYYNCPFLLNFWRSFSSMVVSLVIMFILDSPVFPSFSFCRWNLIAHAFGTAIYSVTIPYCLQSLNVPSVNIIVSFLPVILLIFQYTFMSTIMPSKGNWMEILGAVLCVGSVIATMIFDIFFRERKKKNTET